jgi:hypothetical protein
VRVGIVNRGWRRADLGNSRSVLSVVLWLAMSGVCCVQEM